MFVAIIVFALICFVLQAIAAAHFELHGQSYLDARINEREALIVASKTATIN